jgi:hypothetical protein
MFIMQRWASPTISMSAISDIDNCGGLEGGSREEKGRRIKVTGKGKGRGTVSEKREGKG